MGTSEPASHSKQLPPRPLTIPCPKPPASGGFQKGFRGAPGSTIRPSSPFHLLPALAKRASARLAGKGQHEFTGGCGQAHGTTRLPAPISLAAGGTQPEQEAGQTQTAGALAVPRASAITACCPHTASQGHRREQPSINISIFRTSPHLEEHQGRARRGTARAAGMMSMSRTCFSSRHGLHNQRTSPAAPQGHDSSPAQILEGISKGFSALTPRAAGQIRHPRVPLDFADPSGIIATFSATPICAFGSRRAHRAGFSTGKAEPTP